MKMRQPRRWHTRVVLPTSVTAPATLDHPQKTFVTIWLQDRTTGTATPIRCATSWDRGSSDVLVLEAASALVVTTAVRWGLTEVRVLKRVLSQSIWSD